MTTESVGTPSGAFVRMAESWTMIRDLFGGTERMRENASRYLPQQKNENNAQWTQRVRRAVLHNAFADAVDQVVSSPASRPVQVTGLPTNLEPMIDNVDRKGTSLTSFFENWFRDAVGYGISHIFVDMPRSVSGEDLPADMRTPSGRASLRAARELAVRPYLRHLSPLDVPGWIVEEQDNGEDLVVQIRWREWIERKKAGALYETEEVEVIKVVTPAAFEIWEADTSKGRTRIHEGLHIASSFTKAEEWPNDLGRVPVATLYTRKTATMEAESPFEDLAFLNVDHFVQTAWHRHVLQVASFPILFGSGFSHEDLEDGTIQLGPLNIVFAADDSAKLQFIEHMGHAIQSQERAISKLEEQMETLGMQPFVARNAEATATGRQLDSAKSETRAQSWVRMSEGVLRRAFGFAHDWVKTQMAEDFEVNVHSDFGIHGTRRTEDLAILQKDNERGALSDEDYLTEAQRRGVIREDADVEQLLERAAAEKDKRMETEARIFAQAGAQGGTPQEDEDEDEAVA